MIGPKSASVNVLTNIMSDADDKIWNCERKMVYHGEPMWITLWWCWSWWSWQSPVRWGRGWAHRPLRQGSLLPKFQPHEASDNHHHHCQSSRQHYDVWVNMMRVIFIVILKMCVIVTWVSVSKARGFFSTDCKVLSDGPTNSSPVFNFLNVSVNRVDVDLDHWCYIRKTFDDNRNWRFFILLFCLVLPSPALLVIIASSTSIVLLWIVWVIVSFLIVRWCLIVVAWPIRLSETRQPARAADENEEEDSLEQQQLHLLPRGHFWRSVTPAFPLLPSPDSLFPSSPPRPTVGGSGCLLGLRGDPLCCCWQGLGNIHGGSVALASLCAP